MSINLDKKLADSHELAKEWHPTKNGNLTPADVTPKSKKRVWWRCSRDAGHEWEAVVEHRTRLNPAGCPLCGGRVVSDATPEVKPTEPLNPYTTPGSDLTRPNTKGERLARRASWMILICGILAGIRLALSLFLVRHFIDQPDVLMEAAPALGMQFLHVMVFVTLGLIARRQPMAAASIAFVLQLILLAVTFKTLEIEKAIAQGFWPALLVTLALFWASKSVAHAKAERREFES